MQTSVTGDSNREQGISVFSTSGFCIHEHHGASSSPIARQARGANGQVSSSLRPSWSCTRHIFGGYRPPLRSLFVITVSKRPSRGVLYSDHGERNLILSFREKSTSECSVSTPSHVIPQQSKECSLHVGTFDDLFTIYNVILHLTQIQ